MKNAYLIMGEITCLFINSPTYGMKVFLIDTKDYQTVKKFTWHYDFTKSMLNSGYASTKIGHGRSGTKNLRLHKLLMGEKKGYVIDHINQDKQDNRRINLRFVNRAENNRNKTIVRTNNKTTGIKGLSTYFDKRRNKICYMVQVKGCKDGRFYTFEKAVEYLNKVIEEEAYNERRMG